MRMRQGGWFVVVIAAGCAGPGSRTANARGPRQAETVRAAREIATLVAERDALRRAEADRALATLPATSDEAARRRIVARALGLDPSAVRDLAAPQIAALAPDVLRVYDLGAVLDDGLDDSACVAPMDDHDRDLDGGGKLLARVAGLVRATLPETVWNGAASAIEPAGECLFVLQAPESFADIERALDRFATVGGGAVRVTATATRSSESAEVAFDVPLNRRRSAADGSQISFVKDFDVDAASAFADPIVDALIDGFGVTAGWDGASVELDVVVSRASRPIPEFTTYMQDGDRLPVRIQVPSVQAGRRQFVLPLGDGPGTANFDLGGWSVALRVDAAHGNPSVARPGWRRVESVAAQRTAEEEPLLENALRLAEAQLLNDGGDLAAESLRIAVLCSRGLSWTRRVRLGPGSTEAALLRRPVDRSEADVLAALDDFGVRSVGAFGFVAVRNGALAACVAPESVAAVGRALGALGRSPPGSAGVRISTQEVGADPASGSDASRAGHAATCTSAEQISFIQDFDLSLAEDAAVADPIIGILRSGATISARPVPSSPDTFDVKVTHVIVERPIPVFAIPLGAGMPVTIQLPVLRRRQTTTRMTLAPGGSLEVKPVLRSGDITDERRFTLTRE